MKGAMLALLLLAVAGCATTVPESVRRPPADSPSLAQAHADPDRYRGRKVRWGGTIASVVNRSDETCIEVVGRELQSNGRPVEDDRSEGRFLACVKSFLDPAVYAEGRLLTVAGTLEGTETRPVGEYPYRYPRVRISAYQLWAPLPEPRAGDWDPFWDPYWYGPWPYRPYPYYYPPRYPRW